MKTKIEKMKTLTQNDVNVIKEELLNFISKWESDNTKWNKLELLLDFASSKDKIELRGLKSKIKRLTVNINNLENMIKGNKKAKLPTEVFEKELQTVQKQLKEMEMRLKEE